MELDILRYKLIRHCYTQRYTPRLILQNIQFHDVTEFTVYRRTKKIYNSVGERWNNTSATSMHY